MANFSIKLDLQKLNGAFVTNLQGKAATKTCVLDIIATDVRYKDVKEKFLKILNK